MRLERVNVWREEQRGAGPAGEMRMGDVLELLPSLTEEYAGKVQLITHIFTGTNIVDSLLTH